MSVYDALDTILTVVVCAVVLWLAIVALHESNR